MKCFLLEGLLVDSWDVGKEITIKVRSPRIFARCPECLESTKKIHDYKYRLIKHKKFNGKNILLKLLVRRFRCPCHPRPFTEHHLSGITRKHHTEHLGDEVIRTLSTSNFLETSKRHSVSIPTVLAIAKERQKHVPLPDGDLILNIDEHSYRGRDLKTSVAAANLKKILAVLKDDYKRTLVQYLNSWPLEAKNRVKEVCIDLKATYLHAIKESLPDALIVVDRFHVVKEMNRQVDELRKILQMGGTPYTRRTNKMLLLKGKENLTEKRKR